MKKDISILGGPDLLEFFLPFLNSRGDDQLQEIIFIVEGKFGNLNPEGEFPVILRGIDRTGDEEWEFRGFANLWHMEPDQDVMGVYSTKTRTGTIRIVRGRR